jgi:hypothetical protein
VLEQEVRPEANRDETDRDEGGVAEREAEDDPDEPDGHDDQAEDPDRATQLTLRTRVGQRGSIDAFPGGWAGGDVATHAAQRR